MLSYSPEYALTHGHWVRGPPLSGVVVVRVHGGGVFVPPLFHKGDEKLFFLQQDRSLPFVGSGQRCPPPPICPPEDFGGLQ